MVRLAIFALALLACYEPSYHDCVVRCAATTECAPGQFCGSDGWCAAPDLVGGCLPVSDASLDAPASSGDPPSDGSPSDGSPPIDAPPPIDASPPPPCGPGCAGSCEAGVCVIACSAARSCNRVTCPPWGACRVECTGNESCRKQVLCGLGPCTVRCSGNESCRGGVACASSCACEVACTGNESCKKSATCPDASCRLGSGCTTQAPGCADC